MLRKTVTGESKDWDKLMYYTYFSPMDEHLYPRLDVPLLSCCVDDQYTGHWTWYTKHGKWIQVALRVQYPMYLYSVHAREAGQDGWVGESKRGWGLEEPEEMVWLKCLSVRLPDRWPVLVSAITNFKQQTATTMAETIPGCGVPSAQREPEKALP